MSLFLSLILSVWLSISFLLLCPFRHQTHGPVHLAPPNSWPRSVSFATKPMIQCTVRHQTHGLDQHCEPPNPVIRPCKSMGKSPKTKSEEGCFHSRGRALYH